MDWETEHPAEFPSHKTLARSAGANEQGVGARPDRQVCYCAAGGDAGDGQNLSKDGFLLWR